MEPFFLVCLDCHNAYTWHYRDGEWQCPNGCEPRYTKPWNYGFGPDKKTVSRHQSNLYGDGYEWPDYNLPQPYVKNETEMRALLDEM